MSQSSSRRRPVALPLALCGVILAVVMVRTSPDCPESTSLPSPAKPGVSTSYPSTSASSPEIFLRPLPVSRSSAFHEWTAADATSPEVIEKLAHNPEEFIRLVEENDRIKRRQLVYRKETVPALLDVARKNGQPLRNFILPGLDGNEVQVEVTAINLASDQQAGAVQGRVKGRANSMVSVGFSNGCESFNVSSPDDHLFLTADAREPGEVMVKEIDPDKYASAPCPGPILTENSPPPHPMMTPPASTSPQTPRR